MTENKKTGQYRKKPVVIEAVKDLELQSAPKPAAADKRAEFIADIVKYIDGQMSFMAFLQKHNLPHRSTEPVLFGLMKLVDTMDAPADGGWHVRTSG